VSPSKTKVGQFGYYSVLKAQCVNQSSCYPGNLAFQLFYRGFCSVSFPGWRVAYKLSADAVGVGTVEPHSTIMQQGQGRTCGGYFPGLLIGSEKDLGGPGPEVGNRAIMIT
jgi:hypothetical protein